MSREEKIKDMEKRKPIDYIHEPYRQEILDLFQKLDKMSMMITNKKKQIKTSDSFRILNQTDLLDIFVVFEAQQLQMTIIFKQLIELYAKYFEDQEKN